MKFGAVKTVGAAFALSLLGGVAAEAAVINVGYPGPVIIKFDGATVENAGAGLCTTFTGGVPSGCAETTWGVGNITTIQANDGSGNNWFVDNAGATGPRIFFMIYGIADARVETVGPGNVNIYNVGCNSGAGCDGKIHIDFYTVAHGTSAPYTTGTPADRTGFSTFTGITDIGTPLMKWTLDTGTVPDDPATPFNELLTTLFQTVGSDSLPTTGGGQFFASCVPFGGTDECGKFDNNSFLTLTGLLADFLGGFHLRENTAADAANPSWPGVIFDPVITTAIPEPMTLGIVGTTLLGFGLLRRRREG